MHEYLIEVGHYFFGTVRFQVEGHDRSEALENARKRVEKLHDDNYIKDYIKVVKKLKPSFGKE